MEKVEYGTILRMVLFLSQDHQALAEYLWHGRIHNRWFDKCITVVVCEGGAVGANTEHSMLDAMVRSISHFHND